MPQTIAAVILLEGRCQQFESANYLSNKPKELVNAGIYVQASRF